MKNNIEIVFKETLSKKLVLIILCGGMVFNMWVDNQTYHIFWSVLLYC